MTFLYNKVSNRLDNSTVIPKEEKRLMGCNTLNNYLHIKAKA